MYILGIPPAIFYQLAAPEILFKIGDDSWKGTPFFAYFINLIQFKYMYSSAYFYTKLSYIQKIYTLFMQSGDSRSALPIIYAAPNKNGKKW